LRFSPDFIDKVREANDIVEIIDASFVTVDRIRLNRMLQNVAEELFDRVGLRFVTQDRLDTLRIVKFLKDMMVIMPANIKPSRSRNTLLNLTAVQEEVKKIKEEKLSDEKKIVSRLTEASFQPDAASGLNPHSSEHYKSLQFTCRQLIKFSNTAYNDIRELKNLSKTGDLPERVAKQIDKIDLKFIQKEVRFFYPFEIQIVDKKSFDENEKGRSAHSDYKKAQIQTAMKRVMKGFLEAPVHGSGS